MTLRKVAAAIMLSLSMAAASAQDYFQRISMEGVELMGAITYGKVDQFTYMDEGYYTFPFDSRFAPNKTNPVHKALASGGCAYHDGKIYSNEYNDGGQLQTVHPQWRIYDAKTFELLSEHTLKDNCEATTVGIAYDPTTDKLFGLNKTYTETYVVSIDPSTGEMTRLGEPINFLKKFLAIACNKKGQLYCIYLDPETDVLYLAKIRKTDGKMAVVRSISATNLMPDDMFINSGLKQALFFNNADDRMYWMFSSSSQVLNKEYTVMFEVNPTTAVATMTGYIDDPFVISGAFFLEPDLKAPAIIDDFAFVPDQTGSLEGTMSVKVPSKAYDGSALSGQLRLTITEDGKTLVDAQVQPGEQFTSDKLRLENRQHEVSVCVSGEAGQGPTVRRRFYVGYDVPKACRNIRLTADGLKTVLTWDAPDEGQHGGPLNPEGFIYNVVRYPGEVTVAREISETHFEETHPEDMTRYVYAVVPMDGDRSGTSALSNNLIVGKPLDVPYGGEFGTIYDMLNYYTILDVNKDNYTWMFDQNSRCAFYNYSQVSAADDWLISPPINYAKGKTYTLSFDAASNNSGYLESMQVRFGDGRTPESQSQLLIDIPELPAWGAGQAMTHYSADFTPSEDGVWYYSFHVTTPKFHDYLFLNNIRVEEKTASGIGSITDAEAASANGLTVYSLDGRLVGKGLKTTSGLKKGIYIVNGRKLVVGNTGR